MVRGNLEPKKSLLCFPLIFKLTDRMIIVSIVRTDDHIARCITGVEFISAMQGVNNHVLYLT